MKVIILVLLNISLLAQSNENIQQRTTGELAIIQSIDFDSSGALVFGLTNNYVSSSIVRYDDGNWKDWNLTELFNLDFFWTSTFIDNEGNYWAIQQTEMYKYDGNSWTIIEIPNVGYVKYADITQDNDGNIWVSANWHLITIISDTLVIDYSSKNTDLPETTFDEVFVDGDSIWVCSSDGLILLYNDEITILDTLTSKIPSQIIYSFLIDSQRRRWIGSEDKGLFEWVDDTTFTVYNTENTDLTNNFINAIREDSKGKIWFATDDGFASLEDGIVEIQPEAVENWSVITLEIDSVDNIWLGTYLHGLYKFNEDGIQSITDVKENIDVLPNEFRLYQNYPNPFNPSTKIKYSIPRSTEYHSVQNTTLKVFDILGREVATLVNKHQKAGNYVVNFDAKNFGSGIYFYKLQSGSFTQSKKMILVK